MKAFLLFLLCISAASLTNAQNGTTQFGAKAAGIGYAYSSIADQWSAINNPGGLGYLEKTSAFAGFENKYNISGFNSLAAGLTTTLPLGSFSATAFKFGDDLYNEQIFSLGYGNKFGIAGLGIRLNYNQYYIDEFGSRGVLSIDFGGIAEISDQLRFGAYIRNINQAQLAELYDERIPTYLNAGLVYLPNDNLTLSAEVEKELENDPVFRMGLEYIFHKKLAVRTGIKTNAFTNYFGLGFISQKLLIDYALTKHQVLGLSHQVGIAYIIKQ
ncbi:MAG: hypothetical protein RLO12_03025 [Fulvivirga sp.]